MNYCIKILGQGLTVQILLDEEIVNVEGVGYISKTKDYRQELWSLSVGCRLLPLSWTDALPQ